MLRLIDSGIDVAERPHDRVFGDICLTSLFGGATATLLTGLGVAWARVFLGVHFLLDMLGALAVATFAYAAVSQPWRRLDAPLSGCFETFYRRLLARPIASGRIRACAPQIQLDSGVDSKVYPETVVGPHATKRPRLSHISKEP